MRAPPAGASATRHFPPVERTTASAIASPSPAPSPPSRPPAEPVEQERPLLYRDPRPAVFHREACQLALRADEHTYRPAGTRIATGVVQQDAT